jgi:hypothetical protein
VKKFIVSIILLLAMLFTSVARAEKPAFPSVELLPGEPDIGAAISPMKKGQVAPFTGVLLSPKAVATIVAELNSFDDRIKIEIDKVHGEEKAQCEYAVNDVKIKADADAKIAQAKFEENEKRIKVLEDTIKEQQASSSDPLLYGGLGFGLGVAATVLIVYATARASSVP